MYRFSASESADASSPFARSMPARARSPSSEPRPSRKSTPRSSPLVWAAMSGDQRKLNLQVDTEHLAGTYANFANVSFIDYEFTLTFARIDHSIEEGEIPGVVVARVNMSQQFTKELLEALNDSWSEYSTVKGIKDLSETPEQT